MDDNNFLGNCNMKLDIRNLNLWKFDIKNVNIQNLDFQSFDVPNLKFRILNFRNNLSF